MSDETTVKVRALMNLGQLNLQFDQVGEFPLEQVQPFLDRRRVELVEDEKPRRRTRRTTTDTTDDTTSDDEGTEANEGE